MICDHPSFSASVLVNRLLDTGRFVADVTVRCDKCKRPFQFLGLSAGVDTGGARVSPDGLEARLAICPQGQEPSALDRIAASFPTARKH